MVKRKAKPKKKQMNVFLANQTWASGYYQLHWGKKGTNQMNKNTRKFKKRSTAVKAKNQLVNKYKKQGYKVDYIYAAD
jgi:predicted DNA-binding WGR domain protein